MLRKILVPNRNVVRVWRKLHTEEHCNMYSFPNESDQVKKVEVGRACNTYVGD
jgi:hypothetical protein